jgi:3-oxoacyl-[acyl-carrier protein] reductase
MQTADRAMAIWSKYREALILLSFLRAAERRRRRESGWAREHSSSFTERHELLPSRAPDLLSESVVDLEGKTVLITGAARGLGAAMAAKLADCGAALALVDLTEDSLDETRGACEGNAASVRAYAADVANESAVIDVYGRVARDFGRLDASIANAGILRDGLLVKFKDGSQVGGMSLEDWQAVIDVNLTGVFLCGREAATHMIALGNGGCIVNISSISRHGNFGQSNYSAAKAGVAALATVWSKELARYGIRANAIAPGFIKTDILASMPDEVLQKTLAAVPAGRPGRPDEVADAVAFVLCNDYVNGRVIELDGGLRI